MIWLEKKKDLQSSEIQSAVKSGFSRAPLENGDSYIIQ